jgi:hypothetical protein
VDRKRVVPLRRAAARQRLDGAGVGGVRAVRGAEARQRRQVEAGRAAVVEQLEPPARISERARRALDLSQPELAPRAVPPMPRLVREVVTL